MAIIAAFIIVNAVQIATVVATVAISFVLDLVISAIVGVPSTNTTNNIDGNRMSDSAMPSSNYSAPIPIVYKKARASTTLIWADQITESVTEDIANTINDGGKAGTSTTVTTTTTYAYYADFACLICAGPISELSTVFLNGKVLQPQTMSDHVSVYLGTESQQPDPTMQAALGTDSTPAYRGSAYLVFSGLPLEDFGNRIPEVSCIPVSNNETLSEILGDLVSRSDLDQFEIDSALASKTINGAIVTNTGPIRSMVQVLAAAYHFVIIEKDGKLHITKGRSG